MVNTENKKVIKLFEIFGEDFLGSRWAGERVRELIERAVLKDKQKAVLDFKGITGITQSFGDEIVGIFARAFGIDFVKNNIEAINMTEQVRRILNLSVKLSIKYG